MMHTLKVTLKQHTPLIHFQHSQDGATLRVSEVKPKLDRFVLTKLGNGDYAKGIEEAKEKDWLVGKGDHPSLDYRMRIEANDDVSIIPINDRKEYTRRDEKNGKQFLNDGEKKYLAKRRKSDGRLIFDLKSYPLFFANMDVDYNEKDKYKEFSFTDTLSLSVFCEKKPLFELVKHALNDFFFENNFGMRQSKGFGSFAIDESDELYKEKQSNRRFVITIPLTIKTINEKFMFVFEKIDWLYKALRGGINLKDRNGNTTFYFKSLAFMYAKDVLKAHWDKRAIKERFYGKRRYKKDKNGNVIKELDSLPKQMDEHRNKEPLSFQAKNSFDIRDCFGLSTNEQWLSFGDSIIKSAAINAGNGSFRKPMDNEIVPFDRMRSPILIKPIFSPRKEEDSEDSYIINILLQDDKVGLEEFKNGNKISVCSSNGRAFILDIPATFSTKDFFDYVFNTNRLNIDVANHVKQRYAKGVVYDALVDIFNQIKNNYNGK